MDGVLRRGDFRKPGRPLIKSSDMCERAGNFGAAARPGKNQERLAQVRQARSRELHTRNV
jgi:hypothetical protein